MHTASTVTLESSAIQADLSAILKDLTDMETGERGYLLTDDPAYLQPYTDSKTKIGSDFTGLRAKFATRTQEQQSLEAKLESLAQSKQAEMEHAIDLRRRGFRLRSFKLVATNEGKGYMDEIRRLAASLSSAENSNFVSLENERNIAFHRALRVTLLSSCGLFVLAACLVGLTRRHVRLLAMEAAQSREDLALREVRLEQMTFALSGEARSNIAAINTTSELLLEKYGDFLPRQGQQYAEQMKDAAVQIERLRRDLVGSSDSANGEKAA
jgi:CHASE3 domain sensor protein